MLKMLVLYRRLLLGALGAMAVYVAIVVAGVWLTDLSLFETYVFATPLVSMALPAMFGGGTMTNLALGFGAPRRICFWGWQLAALLISVLCLAMTWLTFTLADGKMVERESITWDWGSMALLFAGCVFALQGSILSHTREKGWRRSLTLTAAWILSFAFLMVVQVSFLLDDEPLFDVLRPVGIANPVWLAAGGGFLAAALVLGVIARIRFAKLVVSL